ncbi:serine hydrolase domain-containing protein [Microbulbifer hainanensis]|uniref:serine hydrolase domain-containing protein n=1 Tax=Microbulbifer hainanensis TaxID=2735675 RepID=UPI001866D953|nr:serine hydrolase [Microbulbifer hainanensis]
MLATATIRIGCLGLCLVAAGTCAGDYTPPKTAAELGLMQGEPPPLEKRVDQSNFMQAPYNRWALQHMRELVPTREVPRGSGAPTPLEDNGQDLDDFTVPLASGRNLSVKRWLQESYTDGFLVLHRGKLVYERYFNGQTPGSHHQMFSATKSFTGTMLLMLADEGKVDLQSPVREYLPELKSSAYGDASVQQVLDMTVGVQYSEAYTDPNADIWKYGFVFGIGKAPGNYRGPLNIHDYLVTLKKRGQHGEAFHYVTPDTDVLGWIVRRVSGQNLSQFFSARIWSKLGAEHDAFYWLDHGATEMAGGGLNITLRDGARLGQMILQQGRYNGSQIVPRKVASRVLQKGDPVPFNRFYQDPWYEQIGYAYHDQWWTFNNSHKAVSAIGVHGQFIYIDPEAQVVIVKQSSHPEAESISNEVDGPQIMHAIANSLMERDSRANG